MSELLTCGCGRQWRSDADDAPHAATCPICGTVLATPTGPTVNGSKPPADAPDAATLAPSSAVRPLSVAAPELATLPPASVGVPASGGSAESLRLPPSFAAAEPEPAELPEGPPGYEMLGELGRGGMGVVYKARQIQAGRLVALKMILAGGHAGRDGLSRFQTEAAALARLHHPHIVQVFEVGEHNGLPFFSLEFCSGGSLDKKLAGTPLQGRQAAALVRKLALAVQAAHQARVIHRDLKPANVLLTEDRQPKITDFGLAKKLDEAGQTASNAVMGTPSYMAPEQAGGSASEVGPPADVYSLGTILYECLTGRPPFKAATALDTMLLVVSNDPAPPRQLNAKVPADLETIALKCLRKEPGQRYGSAVELADDLGRFLRGEPIRARRVGALERGVKWVRRNPLVATLTATALALLVAGTVVSTLFGLDARRQAAEAAREKQLAEDNAQRAEEKERLAGQARDEAEAALVTGLLRAIGRDKGPLSATEVDALGRLHDLPGDAIHLRFLEEGLRTPERARRLGRRAEWVIQAVVGLDAGRQRQVQELLMRHLHQPRTPEEVREACLWLGIALGVQGAAFEELARETLVAAVVRRVSQNASGELAARLRAVSGRLDADSAARVADALLTAMNGRDDPRALCELSEVLLSVCERLDGAAAAARADRAAENLVRVMNRPLDAMALANLSKALAAVCGRLDADAAALHAGRAVGALLAAMNRTSGPYALWSLAEGLRALGGHLRGPDADAAAGQGADALLRTINQTTDPNALRWLSRGVQTVSDRLDAARAARAADVLLSAIGPSNDPETLDRLHEALAALCRQLDGASADKVAAALLAAMSQSNDPATLERLHRVLDVVSGRLDASTAGSVAVALLAALSKSNDPRDLERLTRALAVGSERLTTLELAALLRHPLATGAAQRALLDVLGRRTRHDFRSSWHFLDWARANGVDFAPVGSSR